MKKVIYITLLVGCALAGCRTNRITDTMDRYRYDSLVNVITTNEANYYRLQRDKQVIIDSLRWAKLLTEKSKNRLPVSQKSTLKTSLAYSEAWIDSLGLLNHCLANNDSALLPMRMISNTSQIESKDVVNRNKSSKEKVKSDKSSAKTVYVKDDRFMSGFFYKSGVVAWIVSIIYILWYIQYRTNLQPFTRFFKLIRNLIK